MMHKAWCCLGEVFYCFWRSSVKFQGHTAKKIVDFDPNLAFPDCNFSFISIVIAPVCVSVSVCVSVCVSITIDRR